MEIVDFFRKLVVGRINRTQYFLQQLLVIAGVVGTMVVALSSVYLLGVGNNPISVLILLVAILGVLAFTVYSYASMIKRLHDINIGGPLMLIGFVALNSFLCGLLGFILLFIPGSAGVNEYGEMS